MGPGEKLTVRCVCARTGLTPRHFYGNFRSTDQLAEAAYSTSPAVIASAVAEAFASPGQLTQQISHAMSALVEQLEADPRTGQILFPYRIDSQLISRKRQESTTFFAQISATTASASVQSAMDAGHVAHFVVGGVTRLLSTWLDGPTVARIATTMITALAVQLAAELDGQV